MLFVLSHLIPDLKAGRAEDALVGCVNRGGRDIESASRKTWAVNHSRLNNPQ